VIDLINNAFPDLTIHALKKIGKGKACEVYLANDEIVFKIPLKANSAAGLSAEYRVLSALCGKVNHIPQPLYFGTLPDGKLILGESLMPGIQFSSEIYDSLTESEQDDVFSVMGEFVRQIYYADIPRIEGIPINDPKKNIRIFETRYTETIKNVLNDAERSKVDEIYHNFLQALELHVPIVLCHADMHFWNLQYDPKMRRVCGLLDFGEACYADLMEDMEYYWPVQVAKIMRGHGSILDENAGVRHLFYCMSNLMNEANDELANGAMNYVNYLKELIYSKPFDITA